MKLFIKFFIGAAVIGGLTYGGILLYRKMHSGSIVSKYSKHDLYTMYYYMGDVMNKIPGNSAGVMSETDFNNRIAVLTEEEKNKFGMMLDDLNKNKDSIKEQIAISSNDGIIPGAMMALMAAFASAASKAGMDKPLADKIKTILSANK